MNLSRPAVKLRAQSLIRANARQVLLTSLLFICLTGLFSFLTYRLSGYSNEQLQRYLVYYQAGEYERALEYLASLGPGPGEQGITLLLNCVASIVSAGFMIYLLNVIRGAEAIPANLLDGFGFWWRILLLDLLTGLFVFLWSLLLVVPGLIAAYKYRMARYLLITHPEYSLMDCIRESKSMMVGHKWEIFVLDLSFLGWTLLRLLPVLGWAVAVWAEPYIEMTNLLYYEHFSGADAPAGESIPF